MFFILACVLLVSVWDGVLPWGLHAGTLMYSTPPFPQVLHIGVEIAHISEDTRKTRLPSLAYNRSGVLSLMEYNRVSIGESSRKIRTQELVRAVSCDHLEL